MIIIIIWLPLFFILGTAHSKNAAFSSYSLSRGSHGPEHRKKLIASGIDVILLARSRGNCNGRLIEDASTRPDVHSSSFFSPNLTDAYAPDLSFVRFLFRVVPRGWSYVLLLSQRLLRGQKLWHLSGVTSIHRA